MIISLTGFMGVGKSTISSLLAKHLFCKVIDLDQLIEGEEGLSVEEIFNRKGEQYFRRAEEICLKNIIEKNNEKVLVISLGGGTLISKTNQQIIKEKTFCIYLKASRDTQIDRLSKSRKGGRPNINKLSNDKYDEGLELLFEERRAGYEYCSSLVIDVDKKSTHQMIAEILNAI